MHLLDRSCVGVGIFFEIACYISQHSPPTKLPTPVVAGDSGRREGEPPLVPDDIAPVVKEANVDDDMEDDDDDPDKYFNTAYDDGGLMAQDDEDSGYERRDDDLMLPDLPEPKCPEAERKKSLIIILHVIINICFFNSGGDIIWH